MRRNSRERSRLQRSHHRPSSRSRRSLRYRRPTSRSSRGQDSKWVIGGIFILVLLVTILIVTKPWEVIQQKQATEETGPLSQNPSPTSTFSTEGIEISYNIVDERIAEDFAIPDNRALQEYFLDLVNQSRKSNGLGTVAWDEYAAQVGLTHAIEMATYQYMSHWNQMGFGPDIRYSLAGGTEWVQENVYASWNRYETGQAVPIDDWESVINEAHESLMNSPGHRANILNPEHTHVGIGMAYNPEIGEFRAAQEFINRYIELDDLPQEANPSEKITISGQLLPGSSDPLINIAFEPYPHELTIEALNETSTYQTPAEFVEVIHVSLDSDGNFEAEFELGSQPGLYHVYIWVDYADLKPQAIDRVIWVPSVPDQGVNIPSPAPTSVASHETSDKAPDFSLLSTDGETVSLSDYYGKPVLIFFFASWCQYCQDEAEALMSIYEKYHFQGFDIVAINISYNDDLTQLVSFVEKYGWEFLVVLDENGDISRLYNQMGVPMNVFVTRDGNVAHVVRGAMKEEMIDQVVQQLLSD